MNDMGLILAITGHGYLAMINIDAFSSQFWMKNKVGVKPENVSLVLEVTFILALQALAIINQTRWYISSFMNTVLVFWLKDCF